MTSTTTTPHWLFQTIPQFLKSLDDSNSVRLSNYDEVNLSIHVWNVSDHAGEGTKAIMFKDPQGKWDVPHEDFILTSPSLDDMNPSTTLTIHGLVLSMLKNALSSGQIGDLQFLDLLDEAPSFGMPEEGSILSTTLKIWIPVMLSPTTGLRNQSMVIRRLSGTLVQLESPQPCTAAEIAKLRGDTDSSSFKKDSTKWLQDRRKRLTKNEVMQRIGDDDFAIGRLFNNAIRSLLDIHYLRPGTLGFVQGGFVALQDDGKGEYTEGLTIFLTEGDVTGPLAQCPYIEHGGQKYLLMFSWPGPRPINAEDFDLRRDELNCALSDNGLFKVARWLRADANTEFDQGKIEDSYVEVSNEDGMEIDDVTPVPRSGGV